MICVLFFGVDAIVMARFLKKRRIYRFCQTYSFSLNLALSMHVHALSAAMPRRWLLWKQVLIFLCSPLPVTPPWQLLEKCGRGDSPEQRIPFLSVSLHIWPKSTLQTTGEVDKVVGGCLPVPLPYRCVSRPANDNFKGFARDDREGLKQHPFVIPSMH